MIPVNKTLVISEDDAEIQKILLECKMLDAIKTNSNPDSNMNAVFFKYKDFHAMAQLFRDFPEDKDNGYTMTMFHESVPIDERAKIFLSILEGHAPEKDKWTFNEIKIQMEGNN
jgi:hypothetical protein